MPKAKSSRLREVLRRQGMTMRQLADVVGCSVRSIHNVSCGNSKSIKLRQTITNCLAANIWADILSECLALTVAAGSEFIDLSESEITGLRRLFPGSTKTVGSNLRFIRPVELIFDFRTRTAEPKQRNGNEQ
jgi:hypothetical protein